MADELSIHEVVNEFMDAKMPTDKETLDPEEELQSEQTTDGEESEETEAVVEETNDTVDEEESAEDSGDSDDEVEPEDEDGLAVLGEDDNETLISMGDDQVQLGELKSGYMRLQDYTRKTQAVAEDKRRVGDLNEKTAAVGQIVMGTLDNIIKHFAPTLQQQPAQVQQIVQALHNINSDLQGKTQAWLEEVAEVKKKSRAQIASESIDALKVRIPDWGPSKYTQVFNYYTKNLNTPPEYITELIDAGMMAGLYEGMLKMQATESLKKKVKPGKPRRGRQFKSGQSAPPQRGGW